MERPLDRLKWKCRRGLLELDLVLQGFMENRLQEQDMEPLSALLDLPDNDLWDIVSGRSENYEDRFTGIVARLRAA
ncbi:MAG TPA: succinate dehydrogenase assembly factor 2 [Burkholderiales bacterium]|nr:succinate dehydrogenase assembly factor 2 [Burkholderiales bacterium]